MKFKFIMASALAAILLICGGALAAGKSSIERIESDFREGKLALGQSLLYKLMTIRAPELLPEKYRSTDKLMGHSATSIFLEVHRNMQHLSKSEQDRLKDYLSRPLTQYSYESPRGHYKIHYDTEGEHAVPLSDVSPANGIPDYVEWIADYCDSSYACLHTHLGYLIPPTDDGTGGDNKYDVYLIEMPYYGYCQPESSGPEPWNDYTSFMAIHRNFYGFPPNDDPEGDQKGAAKVTCVHEYFHAIQFGLNVWADGWYMEASSSWIEEICYPQVNDNYYYLPHFFNYPYWSLDFDSSYHIYGDFVLNRFLDQYFDTSIIRLIWEDMRYSSNAYGVLDTNLRDYGSSLSEAFGEFATWNWCTSTRDDRNHYQDGEDYPGINITSNVVFYPTGTLLPPQNKKPDGMSCNYIHLIGKTGTIGDLLVHFDGQDGYEWQANLILAAPENDYTFIKIPLDSLNSGSYLIKNYDLDDYAVLNPVVTSWSATDLDYTYSAEEIPLPPIAVQVFSIGPHEIYAPATRAVQFWVCNRGASLARFNLIAEADSGWSAQAKDTLIVVRLRDSVAVSVNVTSMGNLMPGTLKNIRLTAISHEQSSISSTDSLTLEIFRHNGDANNDGAINVSDAVFIISYIFSGGGHPIPETLAGDADCGGSVNVSDAVYIINYVFVPGFLPPPCLIY